GELETNVTMDAEDLLLRELLGIRTDAGTAATAAWIRSQQREDGTWATFYGGPGELSATVEAYVALRLAGDPPDDPHMARAAAFVRDAGGVERARNFTRLWLALFSLWRWDDLPAMPPEVVLLPPWVPLNVYDFACWARQTVVAVTVVAAHRPARQLPFPIDELRTGQPAPPRPPLTTVAGRFWALDRVLHAYERRHPGVVRRLALRRAERWIVRRQEADGSWGGIQPPWVYSLIALHLQGYPVDHPVMRAGLEGLDRFTIADERGRRLEACQSPVWDTALAVVALADAGLPPDDPAMRRAASWLVDEEVRVKGDWAIRRPHLPPGGWAFEFENDVYPDVDDTAEVVLALRRVAGVEGVDRAVGRAVRWVEGMQSGDGGWAAFDADNTRSVVAALPFCDFGEVIDPPSADVTAHTIEMLVAERDHDPARLARGLEWLSAEQEEDGSWFGRWGVNYVYGTGAAVPALVAAGISPQDPRIRRAVAWLEAHQQPDGGWGEDLRSYHDPAGWRGRGAPTASQTAWALLALLAAEERGEAARRGVAWLVDHQRPDGTWDEAWYTGTGFPWDFSINYHLYRLVFPVMALGRWVGGAGGRA
ncbi:MAG: squalene--hopene cyclase, partial [Acidimicrobiales bacterium]